VTLARPSLRMGDVPRMGPGSGMVFGRFRVSGKDKTIGSGWE
jgi:hypothetical protein